MTKSELSEKEKTFSKIFVILFVSTLSALVALIVHFSAKSHLDSTTTTTVYMHPHVTQCHYTLETKKHSMDFYVKDTDRYTSENAGRYEEKIISSDGETTVCRFWVFPRVYGWNVNNSCAGMDLETQILYENGAYKEPEISNFNNFTLRPLYVAATEDCYFRVELKGQSPTPIGGPPL